MTTTEPTAEDHIREAERLLEPGEYDKHEPDLVRLDVHRAQVHATLAQTLKAAELMPMMTRIAEWITSGEPEPVPASTALQAGPVETVPPDGPCCPGCPCGDSPHGGGSDD